MWKASSSCISRSRRRRRAILRRKASMSKLLGSCGQDRAHRLHQFLPPCGFVAELLASGGGERVELGAAIVVGRAPFGVEESLEFEPVERGIEGALLNGESAAGDLSDAEQHAVS